MSNLPTSSSRPRVEAFCERFGLRLPILLAPMAGACPPALAIAVAEAGGLGACGALLMPAAAIRRGSQTSDRRRPGASRLNVWIPDPPPAHDPDAERAVREFLAEWGPEVGAEAGETTLPDFAAQCDAMLAAQPTAISSIMGLYPPTMVESMKSRGIAWFATATTVAEAVEAERAGADVIVAQGMEAGGHRGAFEASRGERALVGLVSLVPAVVDAVNVPVVATGGIADARGVAAALMLGASAAQIGTGFLRCPESDISAAWADAIGRTRPEDTLVTRAFSGRPGRTIATAYARGDVAGRAVAGPLPGPARPHHGDAHGRRRGRRRRTDAGVVRPVSRSRPNAPGRRADHHPVGRRLPPAGRSLTTRSRSVSQRRSRRRRGWRCRVGGGSGLRVARQTGSLCACDRKRRAPRDGGADRVESRSSARLYGDAFGLEFHVDDHEGDDPWTSGRPRPRVGPRCVHALRAVRNQGWGGNHRRPDRLSRHRHRGGASAGGQRGCGRDPRAKPQPWGTSARYRDEDGNVIELTQSV